MTLLIIDVQKLITTPSLFQYDLFVNNVKALISSARENEVEIIYIRHDDGKGNALTKESEGFEIHDEFKPMDGEQIFDKMVNSPFKEGGLLKYLRAKQETVLIVAGLQTDYCMDAAVKCGFEHGFRMIVPAYANTTFDNEYMSAEESYKYYNEFIWNGRYAECISLEETLLLMAQSFRAIQHL